MKKTIFYLGLALFVLGYILATIFQSNNSTYAPFEFIKSTSPLFAFLLIAVVFPTLEEFCFRSWTIPKKIFQFISLTGISIYLVISFPWWLAALCVIIFALILFKSGLTAKILFSSILFGAIHFSNYSDPYEAVFPIISIIGSGIILAYVSLRYTIFHSIVLHILYNSILLAITFLMAVEKEAQIKTENFIGSVKTQCSFTRKSDFSKKKTNSEILIEGELIDIALKLSKSTKDTIYSKKKSSYSCISAIHLSIIKNKLNKTLLINELLNNTPLKADTATVFAKEFHLIDSIKTYSIKPDDYYIQNLNLLSDYFKMKFNKVILIPEKYDSNEPIYLDRQLIFIKEFDQASNYLLEEYGIMIKEQDESRTIITFYESL